VESINRGEGNPRRTKMLTLESRHEAAFNAASEALVELGFKASISFDPDFIGGKPYFALTGRIDPMEQYATGSSQESLTNAARQFVDRANEAIANPPPKVLATAAATKDAAKELIEEYRRKEGDRTVLDPILDEIADRIEALPVKG
jgi:flavin-binding protein dodecin